MTNYSRGYALERRVSADLRSDGYWTVESRGSHGVADIVALKRGEVLLVQVKRTDPLLSPADRGALTAAAARIGAVPLVAFMPGRTGISYRRLTGVGPKDFVGWSADRPEPCVRSALEETP